jgi:hypothetical protein
MKKKLRMAKRRKKTRAPPLRRLSQSHLRRKVRMKLKRRLKIRKRLRLSQRLLKSLSHQLPPLEELVLTLMTYWDSGIHSLYNPYRHNNSPISSVVLTLEEDHITLSNKTQAICLDNRTCLVVSKKRKKIIMEDGQIWEPLVMVHLHQS